MGVWDDTYLTHRRIFEAFMYGEIAHANSDQRKDYEKWMSHKVAPPVLRHIFEDITRRIVDVIASFEMTNVRTICFLETGFLPPEPQEASPSGTF